MSGPKNVQWQSVAAIGSVLVTILLVGNAVFASGAKITQLQSEVAENQRAVASLVRSGELRDDDIRQLRLVVESIDKHLARIEGKLENK